MSSYPCRDPRLLSPSVRWPPLSFARRELSLVGGEAAHELVEHVVGFARAAREVMPLCRRNRVNCSSGADGEDAREPVLCDRVAGLRRPLEPAPRRSLVLGDA